MSLCCIFRIDSIVAFSRACAAENILLVVVEAPPKKRPTWLSFPHSHVWVCLCMHLARCFLFWTFHHVKLVHLSNRSLALVTAKTHHRPRPRPGLRSLCSHSAGLVGSGRVRKYGGEVRGEIVMLEGRYRQNRM